MTGQPPVPDDTGEPRPPRAPRVAGPWEERYRPVSVHHDPRDTARGGYYLGDDRSLTEFDNPLLEKVTAREPRPLRRALAATGSLVGLYGVLIIVFLLIFGDLDELMAQAQILVPLAVAAAAALFGLLAIFGRDTEVTASAHIVSHGERVRIYELTSVTISDAPSGPELRLTGPFGAASRKLAIPLGLLEANQQLWDLVYNGIRHSTANGAQVDARTRELLHLPRENGVR